MKTEYKYGLDKNRRELSRYQSADWCRAIADLPKKKVDRRGEKQPNSKLLESDVLAIRRFMKMPRWVANILAEELMVATSYIYQLRKKIGGRYKKWPHIQKF